MSSSNSGNLQDLTEKGVDDIYDRCGEDMPLSFDQFKREVTRCRHKWLSVEEGISQTLVDSANPEFYPGIYVAIKPLLTYPVSTCAAERSFSSMKKLKTPLPRVTSDARLSLLSVIHVHKHEEIDFTKFFFLTSPVKKTED